jgi:hypothetical protein
MAKRAGLDAADSEEDEEQGEQLGGGGSPGLCETGADGQDTELVAALKEKFGKYFWPYRLRMKWLTCSKDSEEARVTKAHWRRVHRCATSL